MFSSIHGAPNCELFAGVYKIICSNIMLIGKYCIRLSSQKGSIGECNSRPPVQSHVANEALALQWTSEASGGVNRITRVTALQSTLI